MLHRVAGILFTRIAFDNTRLLKPIVILRSSALSLVSTKLLSSNVPSTSSWLEPYAKLGRYNRPIGSWLLYLPCTWSIALAATPGALPDFGMLALFGIGAILMRGAGCTINDMFDRKYDKQVERTKDRPLASGKLTMTNSFAFLGVQLSASLLILLQLNWYRGFTFNWGALLGYSAVVGVIDPLICIPLYIAGINWTLVYDTIYAFQDIEDDLQIGVKSLAILFGDKTKLYLNFFQMGMLISLLTVGVNAQASWIYYCGTLLTMGHLGRLVYSVDLKNPKSCLATFKASRTTGLLYLTTVVLDKLLSVVP